MSAPRATQASAAPLRLPRVLFVMGKGGVGRSTVSAALGLHFAARGERVLLVEWALPEAIAPWFGAPPAGLEAVPLAPGLWTSNFSLPEALREYFVSHLGLGVLHDAVIASRPVRRLVDGVPGLHELMYLGRLMGLCTLVPEGGEGAVPHFDRFIVDAPATGYGASLFAVPATFASLGAGGLLRIEVGRVERLLRDPALSGALVVTLPEELPVAETNELVPRLTRQLGRPPLALLTNRSLASLLDEESGAARAPRWLAALAARLAMDEARAGLESLWAEVLRRRDHERLLARLGRACPLGLWRLDDQLLHEERPGPATIARRLAAVIGARLDREVAARPAGGPG